MTVTGEKPKQKGPEYELYWPVTTTIWNIQRTTPSTDILTHLSFYASNILTFYSPVWPVLSNNLLTCISSRSTRCSDLRCRRTSYTLQNRRIHLLPVTSSGFDFIRTAGVLAVVVDSGADALHLTIDWNCSLPSASSVRGSGHRGGTTISPFSGKTPSAQAGHTNLLISLTIPVNIPLSDVDAVFEDSAYRLCLARCWFRLIL